MNTNALTSICGLLLVLPIVSACSVPAQALRTTSTETFSQHYSLCPEQGKRRAEQIASTLLGIDIPPSRTLTGAASGRYETMFKRGEFVASGGMIVSLSIDPDAPSSRFFLEGWGNVQLVFFDGDSGSGAPLDGELLADINFRVVDSPHRLSELDQGRIVVELQQHSDRQFAAQLEHPNPRSSVFARIAISRVTDFVYTIDRTAEHELGVPATWAPSTYGNRTRIVTIGYLHFSGPSDGAHLLDLRLVRNGWVEPRDVERDAASDPPSPPPPPVLDWPAGHMCKDLGYREEPSL